MCQSAHGVTTVGEEGEVLIHLEALAAQHLVQAAPQLFVVRLHEAEEPVGPLLWRRLVGDHLEAGRFVVPTANVPAIHTDDDRPLRGRQLPPVRRASFDEREALLPERGLQSVGDPG
jgi:hypothetical protein